MLKYSYSTLGRLGDFTEQPFPGVRWNRPLEYSSLASLVWPRGRRGRPKGRSMKSLDFEIAMIEEFLEINKRCPNQSLVWKSKKIRKELAEKFKSMPAIKVPQASTIRRKLTPIIPKLKKI